MWAANEIGLKKIKIGEVFYMNIWKVASVPLCAKEKEEKLLKRGKEREGSRTSDLQSYLVQSGLEGDSICRFHRPVQHKSLWLI